MKKMAASNVLIVGLKGLGVEIGNVAPFSTTSTLIRSLAKNIVLAGVKSVTIFDPEPVVIQDLSSQVSGVCPLGILLKTPSSSSDPKMLGSLGLQRLCLDWPNSIPMFPCATLVEKPEMRSPSI